ncbi:MAG: hypothetical protein WB729_24925 [Candidatus Sulfotelmatobacter sp.]
MKPRFPCDVLFFGDGDGLVFISPSAGVATLPLVPCEPEPAFVRDAPLIEPRLDEAEELWPAEE